MGLVGLLNTFGGDVFVAQARELRGEKFPRRHRRVQSDSMILRIWQNNKESALSQVTANLV